VAHTDFSARRSAAGNAARTFATSLNFSIALRWITASLMVCAREQGLLGSSRVFLNSHLVDHFVNGLDYHPVRAILPCEQVRNRALAVLSVGRQGNDLSHRLGCPAMFHAHG
jgi:hypothetical protein